MKRYYFDPCRGRHIEVKAKKKAPYKPEENWLPFALSMMIIGFCLIQVI